MLFSHKPSFSLSFFQEGPLGPPLRISRESNDYINRYSEGKQGRSTYEPLEKMIVVGIDILWGDL